MEKLRWGVIGAGGIADRRTIPAMLLAKNAELTAVMEIDLAFAERLRAKYGAKRAYDSEEALLDDPEVDAVYIASPVVAHARQAKLAADRGKPILCEKPIALTCADGRDVVDYCEKKGVQIGAGFMMRFGAHVMNMKRLIAEGSIGQVVSGYSQFTLWLPDAAGNWRLEKKKSGGGAMMDMAVHVIDLMQYITGMRVTRVAAMNETITFSYDVEDSSTLLLRLENGAQCVVQTNFNIPDEASKWRLEFFGTRGRLLGDTVIGQVDGGSLSMLSLSENADYDPAQDHAQTECAGVEVTADFGNMYTREIEAFSAAILAGEPIPVPASDAVYVQHIMEMAYKSGDEGIIIDM